MPKPTEFHIVAITAIIFKEGKVLIAKRSPEEIAYPGKWTVPGGKLDVNDYRRLPKDNLDGWHDVIENTLKREVAEEVAIKVKNIRYLTNSTFIRPDKRPVLVLPHTCQWASGKVKLNKDLTDFAWVKRQDIRKYDFIDGAKNEILRAFKSKLDR